MRKHECGCICGLCLSPVRRVSPHPAAALPCLSTSSTSCETSFFLFFFPFYLQMTLVTFSLAISRHICCVSFNWHLYGRGKGASKEREMEKWIIDFIVLQALGLSPYLHCFSLWLRFMSDPSIFQRICSKKTGITVLWENVINFFFLPFSVFQPSLTPLCLYLVLFSIFFIFLFLPLRHYNLPVKGNDSDPAATRKESFSCEIRMHIMCQHIKRRLCWHAPPPHQRH